MNKPMTIDQIDPLPADLQQQILADDFILKGKIHYKYSGVAMT